MNPCRSPPLTYLLLLQSEAINASRATDAPLSVRSSAVDRRFSLTSPSVSSSSLGLVDRRSSLGLVDNLSIVGGRRSSEGLIDTGAADQANDTATNVRANLCECRRKGWGELGCLLWMCACTWESCYKISIGKYTKQQYGILLPSGPCHDAVWYPFVYITFCFCFPLACLGDPLKSSGRA